MKVGDVVRLNSGGPSMTVVGIVTESVTCVWQGNGEAVEATFPEVCLTEVKEDDVNTPRRVTLER